MEFAARLADVITRAGVGMLLWVGLGYPSIVGDPLLVVLVIQIALIVAKPAFELATEPGGTKLRLERRFGVLPLYMIAIALLLFMFDIYFRERLNRIEMLGLAITLIGTAALILYGFHRTRLLRRSGFSQISGICLVFGYAATSGALLVGQAQLSIITLIGMAALQLVDWIFAPKRPQHAVLGAVFAFVIPLGMLTSLQIGHALAVPLILSYLGGQALLSVQPTTPISRSQST